MQEVTIRVSPEGDEAVVALHAEVNKLEVYAVGLAVKTDEDVKAVTNDLSMIANLKKIIEEKRKEYVGPINDHLKAVNEAFKNLTAPLLSADRLLRDKVSAYRQTQERQRAEQEHINQLRMEAARAEMELKGEITESVGLVEVVPEQPDHYRAEAGTLGTAKIAKWEVADFVQIPDEYKMVDATKIGKVVRAGLRNIPGIRIWEEGSLRVTTQKGE